MKWPLVISIVLFVPLVSFIAYGKGKSDCSTAYLKKQAEAAVIAARKSQEYEDAINREYVDGVPHCDLDGLNRTLIRLRSE